MLPRRAMGEQDCCWTLRMRYELAVNKSYAEDERSDLQALELTAYLRLIYHKRYHHM